MNVHETRQYEMMKRVELFGNEFAGQLPAGSLGPQLLARVAAATREMSEQAIVRQRALGLATDTKAKAMADLATLVEAVRKTARTASASQRLKEPLVRPWE